MSDRKMLERELRKARQNCDSAKIIRLKQELGLGAIDAGHKRSCIVLSSD